MAVEIYLKRGGFTESDRTYLCEVGACEDLWAQGQAVHLQSWNIRNLVIEPHCASEATNPWTATPAEALLRRLPAMLKHFTWNVCDMDHPYWDYYTGLMFDFVRRVIEPVSRRRFVRKDDFREQFEPDNVLT